MSELNRTEDARSGVPDVDKAERSANSGTQPGEHGTNTIQSYSGEDTDGPKSSTFLAVAISAGLIWWVVAWLYGKLSFGHTWGGIPVSIYAGIACFGGFFLWIAIIKSIDPPHLSLTPLIISIVGLVICTFVGILVMEPRTVVGSRIGGNWSSFIADSAFSSLDPFMNIGDGWEIVLLVILIIIFVFILVVLSALIPHFWFVASAALLGLILALAYWKATKEDASLLAGIRLGRR